MPPTSTSTSTSTSKPPKGEYIETDTGNKVARRSQLHGTQHIILGGRAVIQPQVLIRGDLIRPVPPPGPSTAASSAAPPPPTIAISIGRYTFISSSTVLRPPHKPTRGVPTYHTQRIGEHVLIERDCVIEAAAVADRVHIGAGAVLGAFAIVKEGARVLPGCVVPSGMVVPGGAVVGGRPARVVGEVGDGWGGGGEGGDLREMWRGVG